MSTGLSTRRLERSGFVLSVATDVPRKRLDELVAAVVRAEDLRLVMVGGRIG